MLHACTRNLAHRGNRDNRRLPACSPEPQAETSVPLLEMPDEPMSVDVLEWWAAKEAILPHLSRMARQYLGVPATSASAERLFSIAGRAYDDLRQRMGEEMLEILMWARVNRERRSQCGSRADASRGGLNTNTPAPVSTPFRTPKP